MTYTVYSVGASKVTVQECDGEKLSGAPPEVDGYEPDGAVVPPPVRM
jgi:hypothetical protein